MRKISIMALLLCGSLLMGHEGQGRNIENSYIVIFKDTVENVANKRHHLAADLRGRYPEKIEHNFRHLINGVSMRLNPQEAAKLANHEDVAHIEPQLLYKTQASAPRVAKRSSTPWGLDRIDQRDLPLDNSFGRVNLAYPVHVYVVDTGIRSSHNEISDRMANDYFDITNGNGSDCNGHGTHVASIIAGETLGVTHSAVLHNVKVLTCNGQGEGEGSSADVIAGLEWIVENAKLPAVVNMSLGTSGWSSSVNTAVKSLIDRGITVVSAAGNFNDDACSYSPAGYEPVLTVGATTDQDARASFSNDGSCIDLFAPGKSILGASHSSNSATVVRDGTSMAAAHMTGVVVELLRDFPETCPATVVAALKDSATTNRLTGVSGANRLLCMEYTPDPDESLCYSANNTVYDGFQHMEPCGFYYAEAGQHEGRLIVESGVNLDLCLELSVDGTWREMACGMNGNGQDEEVTYSGTAGHYRWRIKSVSGVGEYRFYWKKP